MYCDTCDHYSNNLFATCTYFRSILSSSAFVYCPYCCLWHNFPCRTILSTPQRHCQPWQSPSKQRTWLQPRWASPSTGYIFSTLLIGKLKSLSEALKLRSIIKPRILDIFDCADTSVPDSFIFQCLMYISARSSDFPDDESHVTFYLTGTPLNWFQTEVSHAISELWRLFGP